jgi:hypothetical protein
MMTLPAAAIPNFYETTVPAWVRCDSVQAVGGTEIACSVPRFTGGIGVIITANKFVRPDQKKVWGLVIGSVNDNGRLVDFPSGDRLMVDSGIVEPVNGSTV